MRKKETLGLLDRSFHVKENVVKISKHEKFEHALAKFLLSWELMQSGQDIVTEAIFRNNKRADILALKEGTAYEILCSEKPENILKKAAEYPVEIKPFKADKVIEQSLAAFLRRK